MTNVWINECQNDKCLEGLRSCRMSDWNDECLEGEMSSKMSGRMNVWMTSVWMKNV